ncbi:hypothetical protein AB0M39_03695 [Streptomyces sp. NPDC051907]|uniref:hypothetical protein n=1 Tax=Streptomyces sp. NPDC051907 TaxID=3155284 RepID=UPI00343C97C6
MAAIGLLLTCRTWALLVPRYACMIGHDATEHDMASTAGMAQAPVLGRFLFHLRAGILATVGRSAERLERDSAIRQVPDRVLDETHY